MRLAAGLEVLHRSGTAAASLKVRALTAMVWNDNVGVGLTADFGPRLGWSGGIGGIALARIDEGTGTKLNFLLRGSYCGEKLCLSLSHISHGAVLGIAQDKSNRGLNFMMLEYRYR